MPLLKYLSALLLSEFPLIFYFNQELGHLELVPSAKLFKLELRGGVETAFPDAGRFGHHSIILLLQVRLSAHRPLASFTIRQRKPPIDGGTSEEERAHMRVLILIVVFLPLVGGTTITFIFALT